MQSAFRGLDLEAQKERLLALQKKLEADRKVAEIEQQQAEIALQMAEMGIKLDNGSTATSPMTSSFPLIQNYGIPMARRQSQQSQKSPISPMSRSNSVLLSNISQSSQPNIFESVQHGLNQPAQAQYDPQFSNQTVHQIGYSNVNHFNQYRDVINTGLYDDSKKVESMTKLPKNVPVLLSSTSSLPFPALTVPSSAAIENSTIATQNLKTSSNVYPFQTISSESSSSARPSFSNNLYGNIQNINQIPVLSPAASPVVTAVVTMNSQAQSLPHSSRTTGSSTNPMGSNYRINTANCKTTSSKSFNRLEEDFRANLVQSNINRLKYFTNMLTRADFLTYQAILKELHAWINDPRAYKEAFWTSIAACLDVMERRSLENQKFRDASSPVLIAILRYKPLNRTNWFWDHVTKICSSFQLRVPRPASQQAIQNQPVTNNFSQRTSITAPASSVTPNSVPSNKKNSFSATSIIASKLNSQQQSQPPSAMITVQSTTSSAPVSSPHLNTIPPKISNDPSSKSASSDDVVTILDSPGPSQVEIMHSAMAKSHLAAKQSISNLAAKMHKVQNSCIYKISYLIEPIRLDADTISVDVAFGWSLKDINAANRNSIGYSAGYLVVLDAFKMYDSLMKTDWPNSVGQLSVNNVLTKTFPRMSDQGVCINNLKGTFFPIQSMLVNGINKLSLSFRKNEGLSNVVVELMLLELRNKSSVRASFDEPESIVEIDTCKNRLNILFDHMKDEKDMKDSQRIVVSMDSPLSKDRIKIPARGFECRHFQCFDLDWYFSLSLSNRFPRCPICDCRLVANHLKVDGFFQELLRTVPTDVSKITMDRMGTWAPMKTMDASISQKNPSSNVLSSSTNGKMNRHNNTNKKNRVPLPPKPKFLMSSAGSYSINGKELKRQIENGSKDELNISKKSRIS